MEPIIVTKEVGRDFQLSDGTMFSALKKIDITIQQRQLTILKGRSGSGKTTLLNLIGALDMPTEGEILFQGENIGNWDDGKRALLRRNKMGFVFQSIALIPMMTAYENVEFALRLSAYKGDRRERVIECLKMVGLEKRIYHMPEQMSGGEQQRVGIARSIVHRPSIVFADEPTGALDTNTGLQVIKMLKNIVRSENLTIVMTTHDPGIMELGDKGYELEDGEIVGSW
ncbi:putative ABC transport system ATP-binding protein [Anaerotaenia torta]|uniref:ABC transporter ATP-binding protein n=1 Tax=Anaerotaenia torta TaxID=433293 RepID=UPI003D26288E